MMKIRSIRHLINNGVSEKGSVLILTMIMLAVTMTIIPALVLFMNSGAKSGITYGQRNDELYAADAGVQDAINTLKANLTLPQDPFIYNLNQKYLGTVNGKQVQVTISTAVKDNIQYYKVYSQGQSSSGKETTITAYINAFDSHLYSEHAFTSPEYLTFPNNGSIVGGAQLPGGYNGKGTIDQINTDPVVGWPTDSFFEDYYAAQVATAPQIPGGKLSIPNNPVNQGAIYQQGDLNINPQGGNKGSLTLTGTIYVKGNLNINRPGNTGDVFINLNGQTIFVEGNFSQDTTSGNKQIDIKGPGAIIALGDVTFAPAANTTQNNYVYIMSVDGAVNVWPRGNFYGSINSKLGATMHPNTNIIWNAAINWGTLNLPSSSTQQTYIGGIESWEIDNP